MTDSVHRKGVSHRLELELCAWLFRMVLHPMVQQGPGALGRAHLQACGDPFVAPTENVSEELLAVVEADRVRAQKPAHPRHQVSVGRFQDQVEVVAHQAVGVHLPAGLLAGLG